MMPWPRRRKGSGLNDGAGLNDDTLTDQPGGFEDWQRMREEIEAEEWQQRGPVQAVWAYVTAEDQRLRDLELSGPIRRRLQAQQQQRSRS